MTREAGDSIGSGREIGVSGAETREKFDFSGRSLVELRGGTWSGAE